MHVSTQGTASCLCTTHALSPSLRGFACWVKLCSVKKQKAHLNIFTIFFFSLPRFTRWGGVSDSGTPHLKHSSVPDYVSSNKRHGETTQLFSVITQKSLPILQAPNLDVNASGDWEASFTLTFAHTVASTRMCEKWGWLEVKLALDSSH